jgi:hypothetical protein
LQIDTKAILCGAVLSVAWPAPVHALRPFEGTDASVAEPGVFELEFGYLGYLREGGQKSVIAPAAALNLGLESDNELVVEGRARTRLYSDLDMRRTTVQDAAICLKHVHRHGVLQDAAGPSIASECGILLPTVEGERTGAACTGIVSQHWGQSTFHFNAAIGKNRDGNWERFLGAIVAGPSIGVARPVFETFVVRDSAGGHTESVLAGLLLPINENLAFDVALRKARTEGVGVTEIRAGFTWSRAAHH